MKGSPDQTSLRLVNLSGIVVNLREEGQAEGPLGCAGHGLQRAQLHDGGTGQVRQDPDLAAEIVRGRLKRDVVSPLSVPLHALHVLVPNTLDVRLVALAPGAQLLHHTLPQGRMVRLLAIELGGEGTELTISIGLHRLQAGLVELENLRQALARLHLRSFDGTPQLVGGGERSPQLWVASAANPVLDKPRQARTLCLHASGGAGASVGGDSGGGTAAGTGTTRGGDSSGTGSAAG
mmetsp:Transcript_86060/g.256777  ORF Transcript_86060/g.256777 Transcript_86060/m.256777 type:complete len:235 (-) Transcript_86060:166-870(-)